MLVQMKAVIEKRRLMLILSILGPITTLTVSPFSNLDPINPIKLLVVSTFAGGCLGITLGMTSTISKSLSRVQISALLLFPFISFIAFFSSDSNKVQQFFGVYGRNTGLLSYLALFILLFAASLVDARQMSQKIHFGLQISSALMLLYCVIQVAGLDPVRWSSFAPFGTLGNVNFASAFLGLSAVPIGTYSLSRKTSTFSRILLLLHQLTTLFVIAETGSIQGFLVFFLGYWAVFTMWLYVSKGLTLFSTWLVCSVLAFWLAVMGFLNSGPLSAFLYQETNTFRFDYWHAGVKMIESSPLLGHGFDSYGDLYTQERGIISAIRTSLGRTSNSAHNIFIDIGVNGGLLLLFSFLLILGLAFLSSVKYLKLLKRAKQRDYVFFGLFGFWIAYIAQALISINQIGLGLWTWIITGIMLGISRENVKGSKNSLDNKKTSHRELSRRDSASNKSMGALAAIFGLIFSTAGFAGGYVPVAADAAFRSGSDNRSLNEMIDAAHAFGANSFIISKTVDIALQSNYPDQALQLTEKLIKEFPLDSYAWKIRAKLGNVSESERLIALAKILELDPYFACATPTPLENFKRWIFALPSEKQLELAKWWKLSDAVADAQDFNFSQINQILLEQKLNSFCL